MAQELVIAAFDFDETLITKDSLFDFLYSSFSHLTFLRKAIIFIPDFIRFMSGSITNQIAKEKLLKLFLLNMEVAEFNKLCESYSKRIQNIANPDALERLRWHQEQGHATLVISASIEDWIKPWAKQMKINNVIATKLEHNSNKLTGKLSGKNCRGEEKVVRFQKEYPDYKRYQLYMYGDGKSDQQMFNIADFVFKKKFN